VESAFGSAGRRVISHERTTDPVSDERNGKDEETTCDGGVRGGGVLGGSIRADAPELKGDKERISYSVGSGLGWKLKRESVEVDPDMLVKGLKDSYGGGKTLFTEDEVRKTLTDFRRSRKSTRRRSATASDRDSGGNL